MVNGWFLTITILCVLSIIGSAILHGKEKEGKHNFWAGLIRNSFIIFFVYKAIQIGMV